MRNIESDLFAKRLVGTSYRVNAKDVELVMECPNCGALWRVDVFNEERPEGCCETALLTIGVYHRRNSFMAFEMVDILVNDGQVWIQWLYNGERFVRVNKIPSDAPPYKIKGCYRPMSKFRYLLMR